MRSTSILAVIKETVSIDAVSTHAQKLNYLQVSVGTNVMYAEIAPVVAIQMLEFLVHGKVANCCGIRRRIGVGTVLRGRTPFPIYGFSELIFNCLSKPVFHVGRHARVDLS